VGQTTPAVGLSSRAAGITASRRVDDSLEIALRDAPRLPHQLEEDVTGRLSLLEETVELARPW